MAIYLSNRDGDGKTNEEGHYRLQTRILEGQVLLGDDLKVVESDPLDLSVDVLSGDWRLETSAGYSYTGWISGGETVTISTADPANPRISTIVLYVDKGETTAASPPNNPGIAKLLSVDGTPDAFPDAPNSTVIQAAVGAGNPYMTLAEVLVGAGVTQVTDSNITDLRENIKVLDEVIERSVDNFFNVIGPSLYPIGSIYINATNATNPASLLGFGTWTAFGAGRVPVGLDSGDTDFDTAQETGGSKTHTHASGSLMTEMNTFVTSGAGFLDYNAVSGSTYTEAHRLQTTSAGSGAIKTTGRSETTNTGINVQGTTGSSSNMPPYITVYMWRRTA